MTNSNPIVTQTTPTTWVVRNPNTNSIVGQIRQYPCGNYISQCRTLAVSLEDGFHNFDNAVKFAFFGHLPL